MDNQLQGLLIPPKTVEFGLFFYLSLILLCIILVLLLWRWNKYRKQPSILALKKLEKLKELPCRTAGESQAAALELAVLLCQGLEVNRLDQFQPIDKQNWLTFHNKLNTACYSSVEKFEIRSLLKEAKKWLGGCPNTVQALMDS